MRQYFCSPCMPLNYGRNIFTFIRFVYIYVNQNLPNGPIDMHFIRVYSIFLPDVWNLVAKCCMIVINTVNIRFFFSFMLFPSEQLQFFAGRIFLNRVVKYKIQSQS